jgi:hypothetical protein
MKSIPNKPLVGKSPKATRGAMTPTGHRTSQHVSNYNNPNGARAARSEGMRPRSVPDRGSLATTKTKIC